ncbi:antitoxin family protein [Dehalococcoidia bacterium]|nr:antitoxin family protein [Dehalococcoidia bacterium]
MTKRLHAVFDGKVLKPEESVDLEVGKRYVLTIEPKQKIPDVKEDPAFDLSSLAVKTNISDLASLAREHDHYLYGIPKRRSDADQ